jgi:hypothetical protein
MPQHNLTPWICIARAGTFQDSSGREHTFTADDLQGLAAGYNPQQSEAPLVLGHPKDNEPACGWVHRLNRSGCRLYAQFAHVPAEVRKLVQDRRYRYPGYCMSVLGDANSRSLFRFFKPIGLFSFLDSEVMVWLRKIASTLRPFTPLNLIALDVYFVMAVLLLDFCISN